MLSDVTMRQLEYLDAAVEEPTFGDAAAQAGVSPSTMSQALARLGEVLEVELFEADGRERRLTEVGRLVHEHAAAVLGRMGRLGDDLDAYRAGDRGRLAVGMIDAAVLYLWPEVIPQMRASHGAADIEMRVDTSVPLIAAVADFTLDVAVVVGPAPTPLASELLTDEPLVHYSGGAAPTERWVLYPKQSRTRAVIDDALAARGIHPDVAVESSNPDVLLRLAEVERANTVLPPSVAASSTLHRHGELTSRPIVAVRRTGNPSPLVRDLLVALRSATRSSSRS